MLMEELEPGPYEHKPPVDDALFERLEPHSGIRLAYVAGVHIITASSSLVLVFFKNLFL